MPAIVEIADVIESIPINLSGEEALKLKKESTADSFEKIIETIEL